MQERWAFAVEIHMMIYLDIIDFIYKKESNLQYPLTKDRVSLPEFLSLSFL